MNERCARCGAIQWIKPESVFTNGVKVVKMELIVHLKPQAFVYKNPTQREISMRFCGQCGMVEWLVQNPQELWNALNG